MGQKAICIGGPLDSIIVETLNNPVDISDYKLQQIKVGDSAPIYFYCHQDMTINAALNTLFAYYAKKGRK